MIYKRPSQLVSGTKQKSQKCLVVLCFLCAETTLHCFQDKNYGKKLEDRSCYGETTEDIEVTTKQIFRSIFWRHAPTVFFNVRLIKLSDGLFGAFVKGRLDVSLSLVSQNCVRRLRNYVLSQRCCCRFKYSGTLLGHRTVLTSQKTWRFGLHPVTESSKYNSKLQPTRCNVSWFIYFYTRSTCFRRFLRSSSGAHNCTYSFRYCQQILLLATAQLCAPDDGRRNLLKHVEHL